MSSYEWQDHDGDRAEIVARKQAWRADAVALLTLARADNVDNDEIAAQVYISADQAKELEAFFAGVVMSLPIEQRA